MKIGDIIRLTISDTNEMGRGIARYEGIVVFVHTLVTLDCADVRIVEIRKNFAIGEIVHIIRTSPYRIRELCPGHEKCGGCSLAHVSLDFENRIKQNTVKGALRRAGLSFDTVGEIISPSSRTGYRNKVTVHYDKTSEMLGLYYEETNEVVPFAGCALLPDEFNRIIAFLNDNTYLLNSCDAEDVILKSSLHNKVLVIVRGNSNIEMLRETLVSSFPFVINVIDSSCAANEYVFAEYAGIKMRFTAMGFRQINNDAFDALLSLVCDLVAEQEFDYCADLYCGSGVIGLALASRMPERKFYGIEINPRSVEDAKYSARVNGIENIKFFTGDAASFRRAIPREYMPSTVVLDPPRTGLSDRMRGELIALSPEKIVYVSCNPQTMARDIKQLSDSGYVLRSVTPVNMFPMTKHMECVALLEYDF